MSAVPSVRAPAGSQALLGLAEALWPCASDRWGLSGGVLEGVGAALAAGQGAFSSTEPMWPQGDRYAPPLVFAGLGCARAVARAVEERSGYLQYLPRVVVVEPRAEVALAALARFAQGEGAQAAEALLRAPGVSWFVGPQAMGSLEGWLAERVDDPMAGRVIGLGLPTEAGQAVVRLLGEAHARQQQTLGDRMSTLRQWANSRQRQDAVRARWREGGPLRLLVCTTRYSTYMRHSAQDLVRSMESLGHAARLIVEPDDHTKMTQLHYTRAVVEFEPDGVVLLNYFRPQIGPVLPPYVPVVTWAQDAMGHLFSGGQGLRAGPKDFVAGMLFPELRTRVGVPEERMLAWPNAVSPVKFHRGKAGAGFENLRCDVAMMTRHSERPEAYVRRKMEEVGAHTPAARTLAALEEAVPEAMARAERDRRWLVRLLREVCAQAYQRTAGRQAADAVIESLVFEVAMPLADLHFRQRVARMAARVCERRGWRLHLYGAGWSEHEDLAPHARGELAHGEELRSAYQLAGATIHASVRGLHHQRVAEAAMSGGLPIVYRRFEDIDRARWFQLNAMAGVAKAERETDDGRPVYRIADHEGLMRVAALWGRCGVELGERGMVSPSPYEMGVLRKSPMGRPKLPKDDPAWPLIDIGEVGFATEAELERLIEKSWVGQWRAAWSERIDARIREKFSMDCFARDAIDLVRRSYA
ncbi:MAG: hypothetical protein RIB58_05870 [Phycisphaerales bacterium]